jgi:mRNA interferase RelE/StbE
MTKYQIVIQPSAAKEILKLEKKDQSKVVKVLDALATEPRPVGSKKLKGSDAWRIRVGDFRILYLIEEKILRIEVVRVAHRKDVYR